MNCGKQNSSGVSRMPSLLSVGRAIGGLFEFQGHRKSVTWPAPVYWMLGGRARL